MIDTDKTIIIEVVHQIQQRIPNFLFRKLQAFLTIKISIVFVFPFKTIFLIGEKIVIIHKNGYVEQIMITQKCPRVPCMKAAKIIHDLNSTIVLL